MSKLIQNQIFTVQNLIDDYDYKGGGDRILIELVEYQDHLLKLLTPRLKSQTIKLLLNRDYLRSDLGKYEVATRVQELLGVEIFTKGGHIFVGSQAIAIPPTKRGRKPKDRTLAEAKPYLNKSSKLDLTVLPPETIKEINFLMKNGWDEEEIRQQFNLT